VDPKLNPAELHILDILMWKDPHLLDIAEIDLISKIRKA
jgi:hypothetical protein